MCQQDQLKSTKKTRGVASVDARYGNVLRHNRAGPDDCAVADPDWKDGSIGPDTYAIAKLGFAPEAPFCRRPPYNEWIIDKHRPMRNEAVIPDRDELTDERMRLNTAALTYLRSFLYLDERPYEAAISDRATIEIDWLDDGDVLTKLNIDNPSMPDLGSPQAGTSH
jgi:hypothetical protein